MRACKLPVGLLLVVGTLGCGEKPAQVIERLGGKVHYDERSPDRVPVAVDLSGTQASDAELERLEGFTSLERLSLDGTQVTDAGVDELERVLTNCEIRH